MLEAKNTLMKSFLTVAISTMTAVATTTMAMPVA
jgi:hypothetical protein